MSDPTSLDGEEKGTLLAQAQRLEAEYRQSGDTAALERAGELYRRAGEISESTRVLQETAEHFLTMWSRAHEAERAEEEGREPKKVDSKGIGNTAWVLYAATEWVRIHLPGEDDTVGLTFRWGSRGITVAQLDLEMGGERYISTIPFRPRSLPYDDDPSISDNEGRELLVVLIKEIERREHDATPVQKALDHISRTWRGLR